MRATLRLMGAVGTIACAGGPLVAQTPAPAPPAPLTASFRGLDVAPDGTIWASGTGGTVVRSTDRGATWEAVPIPDAASFDLRDIAAVSASVAYAMVAGADTARIYKTTDGGRTWVRQYDDTRPGVFLDGIAFWDEQHGIAFGDPIDGRFLILRTEDGGARWTPLPAAQSPRALPGEAGFAASGTSIAVGSGGRVWIGTGATTAPGAVGRVFRSTDYGRTWDVSATPIPASASAGIFSLAFRDSLHGIAVGGDYQSPNATRPNVALTSDGGRTWQLGDWAMLTSYLSGVAYVSGETEPMIVAVGTAGSYYSRNGGHGWEALNRESYNAVAAVGTAIVAVGGKGRRVVWRSVDEARTATSEGP